jgi:hypothetical protein
VEVSGRRRFLERGEAWPAGSSVSGWGRRSGCRPVTGSGGGGADQPRGAQGGVNLLRRCSHAGESRTDRRRAWLHGVGTRRRGGSGFARPAAVLSRRAGRAGARLGAFYRGRSLGVHGTDAEEKGRRRRRKPCPPWTLGELGIWAQMGFRGRARGRAGGLGCRAGADQAAAC